jgi:G3E family GTPase
MRAVHYADQRNAIPLTLIQGPLGAGKTAVVRNLLESAQGYRIAAIVNGESSASWENGNRSIVTDDPTVTLASLAQAPVPPDHVIVEGHSTTSSLRLAGYAYMPGYRPDGAVVVAEASEFEDPDADYPDTILKQLRGADLVVLNKVDLCGMKTAARSQQTLSALAPSARFIWASEGRIAPSLLLGPMPDYRRAEVGVVAEWRADYIPTGKNQQRVLIGESCHSCCLIAASGIPADDFRIWADRLPTTVLRGAGCVYVKERPQQRHEFSLIGKRWRLSPGAPWGDDAPGTRIQLITLGGPQSAQRVQ